MSEDPRYPTSLKWDSQETIKKIQELAPHIGGTVTVTETLEGGKTKTLSGVLIMVEITGFIEICTEAPIEERYHLFDIGEPNLEIKIKK